MNETLVDWLTYKSYESNRLSNPHIAYYRWRSLYKDAIVFEEIFENYIKEGKNYVTSHSK